MSPFNYLYFIMRKPWVMLIAISIILFSFFYVDKPLSEFLAGLNLRETIYPLNWFTKLGLGIVYFPLFFVLALFFRYIHRNFLWEERCWFIWGSLLSANIVCCFFKILLGRARPSLWFEEHLYGFYGFHDQAPYWSFPSGHTTTIMSLAFALGILFPRYFRLFFLAGLTVALSRILLVHHYLSDVLAALYLTLLVVGLYARFVQKHHWFSSIWRNGRSDFALFHSCSRIIR